MIHKNSTNTSATGATGRKAAPLGINAKSSSPPPENPRAERYRLLAEARRIFVGAGKEEGLYYPQNYHQTAKCIYSRFGEEVGVNKSKEHGRSFYTGVIQCGRVFTCPVCAAKVQERRRIEISKAFDWAYNVIGKKVILVTFTFPHQKTDDLRELLLMQREAYRRLRSGKAWDKNKKRIGFEGLIRSLEITYSFQNGFHPHTHEAWIVDKSVNVEVLREWISGQWLSKCKKVGLVKEGYQKEADFLNHSVQITDNASNSDYMAKMDDSKHWGADRELAKSNVKQAKGKGIHPYEFLNNSINGDTESERLFLTYADATRGCRQIFWTPKLKGRVGVDELTDEEIAQQAEDKADVLGKLTKEEWNIVVKENAQPFVLDLAETSGFHGVKFWLQGQSSSGDVSKELPREWEPIREKLKEQMEKRAAQLRATLLDGTIYLADDINKKRSEYSKSKRQLKETIQKNTLTYYDDMINGLTLAHGSKNKVSAKRRDQELVSQYRQSQNVRQ